MKLGKFPALTVNDHDVSLSEVLRIAQIEETFNAMDQQVNYIILQQYANKHDLSVSQVELQEGFNEFRKKKNLYTTGETNEWLRRHHLSLDELAEWIRLQQLKNIVREHVTIGKIDKYFFDNRLTFESVTISLILTEELGQARELVFRIEDGEDFHQLARMYSKHNSRPSGGYVGKMRRHQLTPEQSEAVFGAAIGEVVGPVQDERGHLLIKIEEMVRPELNDITKEEIKDLLYEEWLKSQLKEANIKETLWEALNEEVE
jgi:parvulin-like peptidyl-prolyl isomerase